MCKRLDEYLGQDRKAVERFAIRIGVATYTVRRYRLGERIPLPDVMGRIIRETNGALMPNDFYDIPERYLRARYGATGDQVHAAMQAAE